MFTGWSDYGKVLIFFVVHFGFLAGFFCLFFVFCGIGV
jgi:hypothetical protein